jgi:hypothetical protein
MDIAGIGEAATAAKNILGMFFPDKTQEEISKLSATVALLQSQTDINKQEAASSDPLEHWRGGMGWVCVLAYFNNFILAPWAASFGHPVPMVDTTTLAELTLGMLGLGGMHVYQQVNK